MAKVKDVEGEWMEIAYYGEIVTVGVQRFRDGRWHVTAAGWGHRTLAGVAFESVCRRIDTVTSYARLEEAKKHVEEGLEEFREKGPWKDVFRNRSDCRERVQCSTCGKEVNRWDAKAGLAKTPTGVGFFCRKPECENVEPQKQLNF